MGNDIAGGRVYPTLEVVDSPIPEPVPDDLAQSHPDIFSVSVLTRAQTKKAMEGDLGDSLFASALSEDRMPLGAEKVSPTPEKVSGMLKPGSVSVAELQLTRGALITAQKSDPSLVKCYEAVTVPKPSGERSRFKVDNGVLIRTWVPPLGEAPGGTGEVWDTVHQIVVPAEYRQHVLKLAHEHWWSGHLGVAKTYDRILRHFFWPGIKTDVVGFCKTCST